MEKRYYSISLSKTSLLAVYRLLVIKVRVEGHSLAMFGEQGTAHLGSLAFGPNHSASSVNSKVSSWPSGSIVQLTPVLFQKVLSAKQENIYTFSQIFGMIQPDMVPQLPTCEGSILPLYS